MSKKGIINSKGQFHGYIEWYLGNELAYRGNYKNDLRIEYFERHIFKQTEFYIR